MSLKKALAHLENEAKLWINGWKAPLIQWLDSMVIKCLSVNTHLKEKEISSAEEKYPI